MFSRVVDDYDLFEAFHETLVADTPKKFIFTNPSRLIRITNWSTTNRVLVKLSQINDSSDDKAARIGIAGAANIPSSEVWPVRAKSIFLLSSGNAEVTVEAFS